MNSDTVHSIYSHHIVKHLLRDYSRSLKIVKIAISPVIIKRDGHGHPAICICAKCFPVEEIAKSSKYLSYQYSKRCGVSHEYKIDLPDFAEYYRCDDSCNDAAIYGKASAPDVQHGLDCCSYITFHHILIKSEQDIVKSRSEYGRYDKYEYEIQIHLRILLCSLCLICHKHIC